MIFLIGFDVVILVVFFFLIFFIVVVVSKVGVYYFDFIEDVVVMNVVCEMV